MENAANAALIDYLAAALGTGRSDVRLVAGQKARVKTLRLTGVGLADRLSALAAPR